jgi:flagella basal body P-ring formation protein FlgA
MRLLVLILGICGLCAPAAGAPVTAARYVSLAHGALAQALESRDGRVELQPRGTYRDLDLSDSAERQLHARVASEVIGSSTVVWVEAISEGRVEHRVPVAFHVRWHRPVLITRTSLKARAALDASMFVIEEADVAQVRGQPLDDVSQLVVQTGDALRVVAEIGSVRVQRVAIAQSDGFPGQRIRARVPEDNTTLRVEIVSAGNAKVVGDG